MCLPGGRTSVGELHLGERRGRLSDRKGGEMSLLGAKRGRQRRDRQEEEAWET